MADCGPTLIRPSSRHDVSCVDWGLTVHVTTVLSRASAGLLFLISPQHLTLRRVGFDKTPSSNTPVLSYWTQDPTLIWCWSTVYDAGPTSNQCWVNSLCLLGYKCICWDNGGGSLNTARPTARSITSPPLRTGGTSKHICRVLTSLKCQRIGRGRGPGPRKIYRY